MIISHARVHFTRFGTQLGDQRIAHMGHKVCLNVGSVVLARSWLLSGGKPMPAAAPAWASRQREARNVPRLLIQHSDILCDPCGQSCLSCTRACDMIICVVFVCCNHTRYTEYIVINRQQPRQTQDYKSRMMPLSGLLTIYDYILRISCMIAANKNQ
jgi:hypothetical protein